MAVPKPYFPSRSLFAKIERRLTQYRIAARAEIKTDKPVLSLTFDDCPISAAETGAKILEEYGVQGCYYIATGMMGQLSVLGEVTTADHVAQLALAGHEIGAHSHTHLDCAKSDCDEIYADIEQNIQQLREILKTQSIESFAFPYGETRFSVKKNLSNVFMTLRGILPGINRGVVDRGQLRAFEVDKTEASFERAMAALDSLAEEPGWMLIFTHDVAENPSDMGMRPDQLRAVIEKAQALGIEILPPTAAAKKVGLAHA
ncbi:polysaccharide deacetylase family protein [Ponticaulis sp.]|uniref:polysaccharide deacetylase family protein n=1 Tax=Ponticaulis sp. TaxID=2020902 RepID=UPI0025EDA3D9|nr:polysaccharide deacetylase family protein [Ponticaulis sp.]|tara:strand:- start:81727 stop:82503 length:777 start_codon:yes stop_codon:yes gene_type:complete